MPFYHKKGKSKYDIPNRKFLAGMKVANGYAILKIMQRLEQLCDRTMRIGFMLLALLVPLLLTPVNYELFEYNKMMAVYAMTAAIAGAWVGKMIMQKRISIRRTPFDIPIGLFVLSQLVSSLFSMDPHVSWFGYYSRFNGGMCSILSYAILFYAFVSTTTKDELPKLLRLLLGTACVVAGYGVLEHFGIDRHLWVQDVQSRVFSTLGQPNWLAAYLVSLIPLTLAIAYRKKTIWVFSVVPAGVTLLFFLTLLYTRSRSGLIAFTVIDVLFWLVVFLATQQKRTIRTPFVLAHIAFAVLVFFNGTHIDPLDRWITFDGWKQGLAKAVEERAATGSAAALATPSAAAAVPIGPVLETGGTESGVIRTYVWQAAVNAWRSSPKTMFIGTGTETFAFAFYQYKPVGHNLTSEWDYLYNKAHNEYLNVLATTGIFGLGTYLAYIAAALWWFVKTMRKQKEFPVVFFGVFLGWVSLLITNFFGFSVVVTQLLFFLLPAAAYLAFEEPGSEKKTKGWIAQTFALKEKTERILLISCAVLTVIILGILVVVWIADRTFASGYRLSRAGQYAAAYLPLTKAVKLNPFEPLYRDEYANALASLSVAAFENQDATLAAALAGYAIEENNKAIAISPNNVNFWKSKTKIYYALASMDETMLSPAIEALVHAETLSPKDPKIAYNLAILSGRQNDVGKAIAYLEHAIALKPDYRDAYYALFVFYGENKQPDKARALITTYLQTVNSLDEEFQKLMQ